MRADRDIANGLAIRVRIAVRFMMYTGVAVVVLVAVLLVLGDTRSDLDTAVGFLSSSFAMCAALGGLISLGNLFFGNPDSRVSERLLNPAAFGGLAAGGMIGAAPFWLDRGSHSGMTFGSWAIVGLMFAAPLCLVIGAIISFKSNYPRLGDFMMAGAIGVVAAIAAFA
jgi:hypothetical protein